jgi:hypothetical protein
MLERYNVTCRYDHCAPTVGNSHDLESWVIFQEYQNNSHNQSSNRRVEWLKHLNRASFKLKFFIN